MSNENSTPYPGDLTGIPGGFDAMLDDYCKVATNIAFIYAIECAEGEKFEVSDYKKALEYLLNKPKERPTLNDTEKIILKKAQSISLSAALALKKN